MKSLNVFIGMSITSINSGVYSLILYIDGKNMTLPVKEYKQDTCLTEEYLSLVALNDLIDSIALERSEELLVILYSGKDLLAQIKESKECSLFFESIKRKRDGVSVEIKTCEKLSAIEKLKSGNLKRRNKA